jgi:ABC-type transport system substrate-binding protein
MAKILSTLLLLVILGAVWLFNFPNGDKKMPTVRIALYLPKSVNAFDPGAIFEVAQYHMANYLYGRLLKYDDEGQLTVDVPTSFSWSESSVRFVFGDKVKTQSGHTIDAEDAALSIKRLIMRGKSGHGDIRRFLCPGFKLKSLQETCPGISVSSNVLTLTVKNSFQLPMLVAALESADYSIIPRHVIDPKTGELTDKTHHETSGAYFVLEDSNDGHVVLSANRGSYLYSKDMPDPVQIMPLTSPEAAKAFLNHQIDVLPTTQFWASVDGKKILADKRNAIHETLPFRVLFILFSDAALKDFTPEQRMYAGIKAGEAFRKNFGQAGGRPTEQFFQVLSDGTLNDLELSEIKRLRSGPKPPNLPRPITYSGYHQHFAQMSKALSEDSEIKVLDDSTHPLEMSPDKRPDMYILVTDSAWTENFSLIGYNLQIGIFSLPGVNSDEWFNKYISIEDKEKRIGALRKFHFDMLKNASFIPIEVAPYYAAAQPGWVINHNKLSEGTNLWSLRRN